MASVRVSLLDHQVQQRVSRSRSVSRVASGRASVGMRGTGDISDTKKWGRSRLSNVQRLQSLRIGIAIARTRACTGLMGSSDAVARGIGKRIDIAGGERREHALKGPRYANRAEDEGYSGRDRVVQDSWLC